ncbi:MAG: family 10 glycosylhydrolase [Melioribacteraceae bacterium]
MKNIFSPTFLFLICFSIINAQVERETRAVWLTTNYRLDWPPATNDIQKQKQSLIDILEDIKEKNLNTVYFQIRSNGTMLCESSFDPTSPYLTGKVGDKLPYDPLKFAVEEAHKRGLEIHAWINVNNVYSGGEPDILSSIDHISNRKPEWIIKTVSEGKPIYWLDPGIPEVRTYLSDLIAEVNEKYDIDGIHLDYLRLPGKSFADDNSYRLYGKSNDKDDWRRENINELLRLINEKTKSVKAYIKIGVAPIGIYKNQKNASGLQGYSEVYQDSREWLKRGLVDYLVPQIYWGLNETPRFDILAKDWTSNSEGRSIVIGIAAYKNKVYSTLEDLINYSRSVNADGFCFFRYEHIKNYNFKSFPYKTLPATMSLLNGYSPNSPYELKAKFIDTKKNIVSLDWEIEKNFGKGDSIKYYALYSLPTYNSKLSPEDIFEIISPENQSIKLGFSKPRKVNYYFTLKSLSRLWNESIETSNVETIKFNELSLLANINDVYESPILKKESEGDGILLFYSKVEDTIILNNGTSQLRKKIIKGKNFLSLDSDFISSGKLNLKLELSNKKYSLTF